MSERKLLSVVVPVFNEETNIRPFYDALFPVLKGLDLDAEIIFVDDGSRDTTYECVSALAATDKRVKCLRFSRNFGSHPAVMAGLRAAKGDAAVMITVDLQDPPELIPELVARWRDDGYHAVWAVRESRDDPWSKKLFASVFYSLFRRFALKDYPPTGMDFGLFDRRILDCLNQMHELNHFIMGVIFWLGFKQTQVSYHRRARHSGHTKWSFAKRIKNSLDAFVSFSYVPIRFISMLGVIVSVVSMVFTALILARYFIWGMSQATAGWGSLMVAILFLGGVQLIMLGMLGEYIWRGVDQVRNRPQYIVMNSIGFDQPRTARFGPARRRR